MNSLRLRMLHDLKIRNYADSTQRAYINNVARFANHFGESPAKLGPEEIREFQLHLLDKEISWSHFNGHVSALRFLYRVTLEKEWIVERIPFGKKEYKLPIVLTVDEVVGIIHAAPTLFERTLFVTMYGTGMRLS